MSSLDSLLILYHTLGAQRGELHERVSIEQAPARKRSKQIATVPNRKRSYTNLLDKNVCVLVNVNVMRLLQIQLWRCYFLCAFENWRQIPVKHDAASQCFRVSFNITWYSMLIFSH
jgi:hypothetical protein